MNRPPSIDLRLLLERWRAEHAQVEDDAAAANLQRLRWLGPVLVALNALHALIFLVLALQLSLIHI